jgi:Domain of unknown function (DUF927)
MQTGEFFAAVLPAVGPYYAVGLPTKGGPPKHKKCDTIDALVAAVEAIDKIPGLASYFGCAAGTAASDQRRVTPSSSDGRAKALWMDLDCGPDKAATGKGYATKQDAAKALFSFCSETGLPRPLIVDSGGGLHCYWTLTKPISYKPWFALASALKHATALKGLLADPTVTADFSRILRPVGTTNRKREEPREVKAKNSVQDTAPELIRDILKQFAGAAPKPVVSAPVDDFNDDLIAHAFVSLPTSMEKAALRCNQLAMVRDTQGDVGYDHWRGMLGTAKHCDEGITLARAWTEKREATGHSQYDVLTKYEDWNTGPPTCDFFAKCNPSGCDGCEMKGKIKAPLVLGRLIPDAPEEHIVDAKIEGKTVQVQVPALPAGYSYTDGRLVRILEDKDGIAHPFAFCSSLFYPTYRVKREDGSFGLGIRKHLHDGRIREFDIDTGLLASPTKLLEELGHKAEIVQSNTKDGSMHLTAYLRDSLEKLKRESEELHTMTSFGWKHNTTTFLIGDRLYHPDGSIRKVLVGGYAADTLSHFPAPVGTVQGYAKALNSVYNRVVVDKETGVEYNMLPFQYAICSGFGSILTPFGENLYRGLLMCITGGETARGKSTVCMAALYGFGDANRMTVGSEKGATGNALYAKMGTYGSLPLLFDEYTGIEPKEFSEFVYRISEGKEKERQTVRGGSGVRMASQVEWALSPYVTANKDLHAILAQHAANSQAEAVRMVQIKIDDYKTPTFEDSIVDLELSQMKRNMGSAGEAMVQWVVQNTNLVEDMFREVMSDISTHIPGPKYRFYRNHATTTLVALKIMHQLQIAEFDYQKLRDFAIHLMRKLADEVSEANVVTAEDSLSMLINDLMPRLLSTKEYRDGRDARGPEYGNRIQQAFAGRYIYGDDKKSPYSGRLYLVKKDVKDWCVKHRVELSGILSHARANGYLVTAGERFNLTKGTEYAAVQTTCIVFDTHAMDAALPGAPKMVLHSIKHPVDDTKREAV